MAERLTLARPYAQAVFDVARVSGRLADWSAALHAGAEVIAEPQVAALLNHPSVADATLVALVEAAAVRVNPDAARVFSEERGQNVLRLLAENERLGLLREIARLFDELKDAEEDRVDVEVVSATELDEDARSALTASLERRLGHQVRLCCSVDPALIGGLVIRADDLVIDGSVRHSLDQLAHALIR